jgi:hypothetical protein
MPDGMVNPALQSAIDAMSLDERLELVESIGLTWVELKARLAARRA